MKKKILKKLIFKTSDGEKSLLYNGKSLCIFTEIDVEEEQPTEDLLNLSFYLNRSKLRDHSDNSDLIFITLGNNFVLGQSILFTEEEI